MKTYHTIIIGLGAMGSATLYQLAKSGVSVLGLDRFTPPHTNGSSHGETRITRQAIGEGSVYTPLSLRSYEIWEEIEHQVQQKLLHKCGGLILSSEQSTANMHGTQFFENTLEAARMYDINHEILQARQIRKRFPQFKVDDTEIAYYEPEAGYLIPEACIRANLKLAEMAGAEIRNQEVFLRIENQGDIMKVITNESMYLTERIIFTAGPWMPELLKEQLEPRVKVYRQVMTWFEEEGNRHLYHENRCPVYIWELRNSNQPLYGFPNMDGNGVKICTEYFDETVNPDTVNRELNPTSFNDMFDELVEPYFHHINRKCVKATACLYSVTEDFQFIIDRHPDLKNVWFASACSGHGFKHSAAIGEVLSQLALDIPPSVNVDTFSFSNNK